MCDLSDFTNDCEVILTGKSDKIHKLKLYNLPVVVINTPNSDPITSKETRVEGCSVTLYDTDGSINDLGSAGIRGRGQSSWSQPKKPYIIKFEKKQEILGMNKSKHWILLANAYYDRTQLHNATAFEMARLTGFPWVQEGRFVELLLNGCHKGLYYLCEKIGAENHKIELMEYGEGIDENNCGYLLESYVVHDENLSSWQYPYNYFNTGVLYKAGYSTSWSSLTCEVGWEIKEPYPANNAQIDFIKAKLREIEMSICNHEDFDKIKELIDIETFID